MPSRRPLLAVPTHGRPSSPAAAEDVREGASVPLGAVSERAAPARDASPASRSGSERRARARWPLRLATCPKGDPGHSPGCRPTLRGRAQTARSKGVQRDDGGALGAAAHPALGADCCSIMSPIQAGVALGDRVLRVAHRPRGQHGAGAVAASERFAGGRAAAARARAAAGAQREARAC